MVKLRHNKANVIVIDPGLREAAGHHAGFATFAVDAFEQGEIERLHFICHQELNPQIEQKMQQVKVGCAKVFDLDFYQYFDYKVGLQELDDYLAPFSDLYLKALHLAQNRADLFIQEHTEQTHPTQYSNICFYPCVTWQHAAALATALTRHENKQSSTDCSLKHVVCAMYNPGIDGLGKTMDINAALYSKLTFGWLTSHKHVQLFASDHELSLAYQSLLKMPEPLSLHPCYLANWKHFDDADKGEMKQHNNIGERVILYIGDAKHNKGFNNLPALIRANLGDHSKPTLVIHYSNVWQLPQVNETIKEITTMAEQYEQIELHTEYWDQQELVRQFKLASAIVFNYDAQEYQNKSSGVLWLAVYANLVIMVANRNWLFREANRLEASVIELVDNEIPSHKILVSEQSKHVAKNSDGTSAQYNQQLYQAFWPWLSTVTE